MKMLSEMIAELQQVLKDRGDLPVFVEREVDYDGVTEFFPDVPHAGGWVDKLVEYRHYRNHEQKHWDRAVLVNNDTPGRGEEFDAFLV